MSDNQDLKRSRPKKSLGRKIVTGIFTILVVLAAVIGLLGYKYFQDALKPLDRNNNRVSEIKVPLGASNKQIGSILQNKNIVKSGMVFDYYVKSNNLSDFKAGYYQLKPSMSLKQIAQTLQRGGSDQPLSSKMGKLLVREGANIDQIADELAQTTKFSKRQFLQLVNDTDFVNSLKKRYPKLLSSAVKAKKVRYKLEGYLYPATYDAKSYSTLKSLITAMVGKMDEEMTPYYAKIAKMKLTVQEFMTLASLIEREGVDQVDRQKMAGVLLNRVDINMPIQSDVAVLYAIHRNSKALTKKDLQIDSPYNLYVNAGFGPGPFDNPSRSAIQAVANPLERDKKYLYFVANIKTQKVYYSQTFEQHQENIDKHAVYE